MVLKGILTRKDWNKIKEDLKYDFTHDNYFSELKEAEILRERLQLANEVDQFIGKYYSVAWLRKNVLRMSEEEINDMDKEIKKEQEDPDSPMNDDGMEDEPNQSPPDEEPTNEEIEIPQEISEEEKQLIKSMTKFMDSMVPSENEEV